LDKKKYSSEVESEENFDKEKPINFGKYKN